MATTAFALAFTGTPKVAKAGHLFCVDVLTEDTTLDADLDCTGSSGFRIGAMNVTLDLGGHTLTGDASPAGFTFGVSIIGVKNVTIKNGTIDGFKHGVRSASVATDLRNNTIRRENQQCLGMKRRGHHSRPLARL